MNVTAVVVLVAATVSLVAFAASAKPAVDPDLFDVEHERSWLVRWLQRHRRVRRFLRQRRDRRRAGGWMLTVAFLIVLAVATVLGLLLDMVDETEGLARFDASVSRWGADNASSSSVDVLRAVTHLGSNLVVVPALALTALVDYRRHRDREVFAFVFVVATGEWLINNGLKLIVGRDRPEVMRLVSAVGHSFPSGHTAAASAAAAAIALILGRGRSRRARAALAAAAALVATAVAASRALLGVHWLTDVIGGLAVGWGWFVLTAVIFGGRRQQLGEPVTGPELDESHRPGTDVAEGAGTFDAAGVHR